MPTLKFMTPAVIGSIAPYDNNPSTKERPSSEPSRLGWETMDCDYTQTAIVPTRGILEHSKITYPGTNGEFVYSITGDQDYVVVYSATDGTIWAHTPSTGIPQGKEITRTSGNYTGDRANGFDACYLNGIVVITNNKDLPQLWLPIDWDTLLIDLTNWPASTTCKIIRAYKNYLIAFNITKNSTNYPTLVKWSHVTLPGVAPTSWDETDATVDAGEKALTDTPGKIIDVVPLKDSLIIYKENSIIRMQWVGGQDIFRWDILSTSHGLVSYGAAVEYQPGWHVMISQAGQVIKHNGQRFEVLGNTPQRELHKLYWTATLGPFSQGYIANDPSRNKVYFMHSIRATAYGSALVALKYHMVWDYDIDKWSFHNNNNKLTWNVLTGLRLIEALITAKPAGTSVWGTSATEPFQMHNDSADFNPCWFSTEWLNFGRLDKNGKMIEEPDKIKLLTTLRPIFTWPVTDNAPKFRIRVYTLEALGGTIVEVLDIASWDAASNIIIEINATAVYYKIKFSGLVTGRLQDDWKFLGYELEVETAGDRVDS